MYGWSEHHIIWSHGQLVHVNTSGHYLWGILYISLSLWYSQLHFWIALSLSEVDKNYYCSKVSFDHLTPIWRDIECSADAIFTIIFLYSGCNLHQRQLKQLSCAYAVMNLLMMRSCMSRSLKLIFKWYSVNKLTCICILDGIRTQNSLSFYKNHQQL